jgi:replicative DNA helicase
MRLVSEAEKQAEKALVGFALLQPQRALDLEVEPHHFADPRWAKTWGVIRTMAADGVPVDEVTVADRMDAEGARVLCDLSEAAMQPAVLPEHYAGIVRDGWIARQVLFALSSVQQAHREGMGGADLLSLALERLAAVHVEQPGRAQGIAEMVKDRYRELSELAERKAKGERAVTGIETGIRDLDDLLGGLQRGICTVVAARPGMGKSAFGQTITDHASSRGVGVHVFSLEDTASAYTDRAISRESGVAAEAIRTCNLHKDHLRLLGHAAQSLYERCGWIVDHRSAITAEEVVRSVRRELGANRTNVVIVDYVQLLKAPPGFLAPGDKTAVVDHAMNVLADAAKQDHVAYVVLAQLNRECEKRENKRPMLSDLKQSGAIEERAKAVLMLYRPSVYREVNQQTKEPYPESRIELLLRKNNQGRTGKVNATWDGPTTTVR